MAAVGTGNVVTELERCLPWIKQALDRSGRGDTVADVIDQLVSGHAQLWPAPRGCIVTQVDLYKDQKALRVWLAGGELDQITDMTQAVAAWAKEQGCAFAEFDGRRGWLKPLKALGWNEVAVTMRLDLGA